MEISKSYEPKEVEAKWLKEWEEKKYFHSEPDDTKKPYTIVIPPPNVTGSLHMGHALNNLLQDILIRYKRMNGFNACWVPGTDHGGIATQNVVEKLLKKEGKTKEDLGRGAFVEKMWQWRKETGDTILYQLRKLGCSCDWDKTAFTMDEKRSRAVNTAFIEFFKKGMIYRGERIVDWCPRCGTALNESEVEQKDEKGHLWYIKYPIEQSEVRSPKSEEKTSNLPLTDFITVATTRPETMLGDTAVAVNPNDERYKKYIGKNVVLPLVNRIIPIIADEMVDPKFGTGAVKITPAHDRNDAETARRHNLVFIHAIDKEAKITINIALDLTGKIISNFEANDLIDKDRYTARKILLEKLKEKGFLEKEENYILPITRCYRCETATEPLISKQWFLKMDDLAKEAIESAKKGETKFSPESWYKPYILWLENLKDWCISRQIWWGHRIPLWYCTHCLKGKIGYAVQQGDDIAAAVISPEESEAIQLIDRGAGFNPKSYNSGYDSISIGNISKDQKGVFPSETKPEKCPHCGKSDFIQDPDVLDTWFSSALWPMSVLGWPEETPELKYYYPTDVLVTGHEILYLWVARMIMTGLEFRKEVPFTNVYIHGIVRDSHGKKMSKSLGNVIDPLDIMEKFGTDALRFSLAYQGIPGRDMQISDENFIMARNFANKLWNVSRFVLMNLETASLKSYEIDDKYIETPDEWILSELDAVTENVRESIETYNPAEAARSLYDFIWSKYCDWYVEFSKIRIYGQDKSKREHVLNVHIKVLENILKLLHPVMPFITEEIYQNLRKQEKSIMISEYPLSKGTKSADGAGNEVSELISIITAIRNIRSEMDIKPAELVDISVKANSRESGEIVKRNENYIKILAKTGNLLYSSSSQKPAHSASAVVGDIEIYVLLEGKIDFKKEKIRLENQLKKIIAELGNYDKKLTNKNFVERADPAEVERVKEKSMETSAKKEKIEELIKSIED